jgi:5'-3' exonuclease
MGIPRFRGALLKYFEGKRIEVNAREVSNCQCLYIDVNSVIHTAIQVLLNGMKRETQITKEDYKECAAQVINCLLILIQYYRPSKLVYLAVDGVVPMAKIKQQKERRYASAMKMEQGDYDSNIVSPGTEFMKYLNKKIIKKVVNQKNAYGVKDRIVLSSHLVPGEGEHKITNYIRTNETVEGTSVIYGNDADLILLGLGLGNSKVYICGDTVQLYTTEGNHIPMMFGIKKPISIDALRDALTETIGEGNEEHFIFSMSLLGNDFLPRSPVMSDVTAGFNEIMDYLTKGYCNSYKNMDGLLTTLADKETFDDDSECSLLSLRKKYASRDIDKNSGHVKYPSAIFDAMVEHPKRMDSVSLFRQLWYTKCFNGSSYTDVMDPVLLDMCMEYLRGMHWVKSYYLNGQDSVTWLWLYPYNHAPLFKDLLAVVLNRDRIKGFKKSFSKLIEPNPNEIRFSVLHQLVSIMPIQSYLYLPQELYQFYTLKGGLLHIMPSAGIVIDSEFTEKNYQERPILPLPNYYEIMTCLQYSRFKKSFLKEYTISDEYVYSVPPLYNNKLAPPIVPREKPTFVDTRSREGESTTGRGGSERGRGTSTYIRSRESGGVSERGSGSYIRSRGSGGTSTYRGGRGRGTSERGGGRGRGTSERGGGRGRDDTTEKPKRLLY